MKSTLYIVLPVLGLFSIAGCKTADTPIACDSDTPTPYELVLPQGFPPMEIPEDNALTVEGIELGRQLFYDPILSKDSTQSCASCHMDFASYSDTNHFSTGVEGLQGTRNAMAVVNVGYSFSLFWDGRAESVEAQALEPVPNPIEMNLSWPEALTRLNDNDGYRQQFKFVFGVDIIDSMDVAKAIAQFERIMISGNARFDKAERGEVVLTPLEREGQVLFFTERGDCFHCHGTRLFMGFVYENNGLQATITDPGRGEVTGLSTDIGLFKPPTLRNIELTAPYMHDSRFNTLEEVVEFYNSGVNQNSPNISPLMTKGNRPGGQLGLTPHEKEALVAFLKTLTDTEFVEDKRFQSPF